MVIKCAGVVLASVMAFAPVGWAQNVKDSGAANPATGEINRGPEPGQAGTGAKVAPWTKPGQATAQTGASNQTEQGPDTGKTGIGPRGTKVAPPTGASNEPGQAAQPATGQTGVEPRGTKVAPSTNPGQSGEQTR